MFRLQDQLEKDFPEYNERNIMLSSNNVCVVKFDIETLRKMTKARIKAFKTACFKSVGNRFGDWCCDTHCEFIEKDRHTEAYEIYCHNLATINAVYAEKS